MSSWRDPLELEADAIADRVMRSGGSGSSLEPKLTYYQKSAEPAAPGHAGTVQRKCAECEKEDEEKRMVRRSARSSAASAIAPSPLIGEVLRSSGSPLDRATLEFMESRFNQDFSKVRVHSGPTAAESARQMNARAYTVGSDIVFGEGQYAPSSDTGRHLLAHELVHTVQQETGTSLVQRAEVDDEKSVCEDFDDIESELNDEVNSRLDKARVAAGAGFENDPAKVTSFLVDAKNRLSTFEDWVWKHPDGEEPTDIFGNPDLSGTKYEDADKSSGPRPNRLAAVVKVRGLCVGSDKYGHFFVDGWDAYRAADKDAAELHSNDWEIGSQGLGATGVFSRADILANLAGRRFYQHLESDPLMRFEIGTYQEPQWNERILTNYYSANLGEVVWRNALEGDWEGSLVFANNYTFDVNMEFTDVNMSARTVKGTYEESVADGSFVRWWKLGKFVGDIEFRTTHVKGASTRADATSGVNLTNIRLTMASGGPVWNGELRSVYEHALQGELTSSASGDTGAWYVEKD